MQGKKIRIAALLCSCLLCAEGGVEDRTGTARDEAMGHHGVQRDTSRYSNLTQWVKPCTGSILFLLENRSINSFGNTDVERTRALF